jgi:hypothetical protein
MQKRYTIADLDVIIRHYAVAALWSSTDDDGEPMDANYDFGDMAPETIQTFKEDCTSFAQSNIGLLHKSGLSLEQIGYDFWLTRNGHGCGFWDRGLGKVGDDLTVASKVYPAVDLYIGDDGLIYC